MPTLLSINTVANSGSTGHIAEGIAEMAIADSWECHTAYGRWANPSKTELYKIGGISDVYTHFALSRVFGKHGLASKRATRRLIKKIEEIKPDIIHLHNIHGYYVNYTLLFDYLSSLSTPVVWTLHDCWAYTGHCAYYSSASCFKWKTGCGECPNLNNYPAAFKDRSPENYRLKKEAFTSVPNILLVPVSKWLEREVRQSFLAQHPIHTISNGVDVHTFSPVPSGDIRCKYGLNGKFVILGVANKWEKRKGLSDFIELSEYLSDDELIVLVGVSKKQKANLPANITGIEKTEDVKELAGLYSSADLFINFSVEETFGLSTVESMSCGTPVLVYDSTACPDVVTEQTGFIIAPHDVIEANNIIKHVKKNGKSKYSSPCREHVLNNYNQHDRYKEYLSLYDQLLKRS